MSKYTRCPTTVNDLASEIMFAFPETYQPVIDAKVTIDFVFAYADQDDSGEPTGFALKQRGFRVLGMTRKITLKDRALGRADVEIALDGDWWPKVDVEVQKALLDHELNHIEVEIENGKAKRDDLDRPVVSMRPHDYEIGLFTAIAKRHGKHSQEVMLAAQMMEDAGSYYWPDLFAQGKAVAV